MRVEVTPTAEAAARVAARYVADCLREALRARGVATAALSGGSSPKPLFAELSREPVDWPRVHLFQVDERVAPRGSGARNLDAIEQAFAGARLHPIPVEAGDLEAAAADYAASIAAVTGPGGRLDVVQLGLGADGHTASLFAGDAALAVTDRAVAVTGFHAGYRRLTLTLPAINTARAIAWFVTGTPKAAALADLLAGRSNAPASAIAQEHGCVFADAAARPG